MQFVTGTAPASTDAITKLNRSYKFLFFCSALQKHLSFFLLSFLRNTTDFCLFAFETAWLFQGGQYVRAPRVSRPLCAATLIRVLPRRAARVRGYFSVYDSLL